MKKQFLLFIFTISLSVAYAQNQDAIKSGLNLQNLEKTAKLKQLYQEAKAMEDVATAAEINANREAIKAAWQEVNPAVAALYKPVDNGGALPEIEENVHINGVHKPAVIKPKRPVLTGESRGVKSWGVDAILREDWTDGIDMDVTYDEGVIYIAGFVNNIDFGGSRDSIYVYKSENHGGSFSVWKTLAITSPIRKMQLVSIDQEDGDQYVVTYILTDSHTFQAMRWNSDTGALSAEVIASDVIDFSVDRNFTSNTSSIRVFGIYQKSNFTLYAARSTAGDYGLNWVDEHSLSYKYDQGSLCYGLNGSIYITGVGHVTGNLVANANTNYNDPGAWESFETLEEGSVKESVNPVIIAARKPLDNDFVIVQTQSRNNGTSDGYDAIKYKRIAGAPYTSWSSIQIAPANTSIEQIYSWIRRYANTEEFHRTYVKLQEDGPLPVSVLVRTYAGTGTGMQLHVFDDVFGGYPLVVAETKDHQPCVAYALTNNVNPDYGWGIYFDAKSNLLENSENIIDGFSMYPNPVSGILTIKTTNPIHKVSIYNMLGQEIITSKEHTINTSRLTAGSYIVRVKAGNQTGSYMLIKE